MDARKALAAILVIAHRRGSSFAVRSAEELAPDRWPVRGVWVSRDHGLIGLGHADPISAAQKPSFHAWGAAKIGLGRPLQKPQRPTKDVQDELHVQKQSTSMGVPPTPSIDR